jgi:hypothetical protein
LSFTASGVAEQRIYAVVDPDEQTDETNEDNNKGYGVLLIGHASYVDPGLSASREYHALNHSAQGATGGQALAALTTSVTISAFVPLPNFTETTLFELASVQLPLDVPIVGEPFQITAYQGGDLVHSFGLVPTAAAPPAVVMITYGDEDVTGMDEENLELWRLQGPSWETETCFDHQVLRFPQENRVVVPVCHVGTFVLSDQQPSSLQAVFLPLVTKNILSGTLLRR